MLAPWPAPTRDDSPRMSENRAVCIMQIVEVNCESCDHELTWLLHG